MTIRDWQELYRNAPSRWGVTLNARMEGLPAVQSRAVWAWKETEDRFDGAAPPDAPLRGVPFAVKDLFHLKGAPTRAGSIIPAKAQKKDGNLVRELRRLGALPCGKTNLHELAYGMTGANPHFGDVAHPRHPSRTSGGSSSGSAAVVAAGIVPFALGTDTAGSLRVPAAYCGLYSWRDIPGHDWIRDAFPLAPKFDTAGWLATSARDVLTIFEALNGEMQKPVRSPRGAYLAAESLGVETSDSVRHKLVEVSARLTTKHLSADHDLAVNCRGVGRTYAVLQSTDAYAGHQWRLDTYRELIGPDVWSLIDRGRHWTASQIDTESLNALKIRAAFDRFFTEHDFLVTPISPGPAPLMRDRSAKVRDDLLQLNTHVSVAGLPTFSIPVPLGDDLTTGLQIVFPSRSSSAIKWAMNQCETS